MPCPAAQRDRPGSVEPPAVTDVVPAGRAAEMPAAIPRTIEPSRTMDSQAARHPAARRGAPVLGPGPEAHALRHSVPTVAVTGPEVAPQFRDDLAPGDPRGGWPRGAAVGVVAQACRRAAWVHCPLPALASVTWARGGFAVVARKPRRRTPPIGQARRIERRRPAAALARDRAHVRPRPDVGASIGFHVRPTPPMCRHSVRRRGGNGGRLRWAQGQDGGSLATNWAAICANAWPAGVSGG